MRFIYLFIHFYFQALQSPVNNAVAPSVKEPEPTALSPPPAIQTPTLAASPAQNSVPLASPPTLVEEQVEVNDDDDVVHEELAAPMAPPSPHPAHPEMKNSSNKRKRRESDETNESNLTIVENAQPPKAKKKRRSSGGQHMPATVKKDKLYCICKTRYDPKK